MDKLPNELHDMVASHLPVKDLRSYRLINRRYESIANRRLFQIVRFVFHRTLPDNFTFRPAIAQFIRRVHIDTSDGQWRSHDKSLQLKTLIRNLHSAGSTITELCLKVGETYEYEPMTEKGYAFRLPITSKNVESYMSVLAECSSLLSSVTHFQMTNYSTAGSITQVALSSLLRYLKSLNKLQCMDLNLGFHSDVSKDDLHELWKIFLAHYCPCPEQRRLVGDTWVTAPAACNCQFMETVWRYSFKYGYH